MRPKYNAKPTECDQGHCHDSKLEAGRCDDLTALEALGEIVDLEQQPEYRAELNGKLMFRYKGDFRYHFPGSTLDVCEDAKGMRTPVFNLKFKIMPELYPDTIFTVWPPKVRKRRKARKSVSEGTIKE